MNEELWIGLVAFKAFKKGIIEEGQEAFVNLILCAFGKDDYKKKAMHYLAGQGLEAFDFRQIELYSYRKGFWNDKEIVELAKRTEEDKQPRHSSLTVFTPLLKLEWKTWLFEFHDLAFVSFIADFEESAFSLMVVPYNDIKRIYENYKVTFTKTIKMKLDGFDMTDTTNAYGPEVTSLDIKEIKNGLYEAEIILLYGEHSKNYLINLWFEDITIEKLSESIDIKFRFGSWETRVDIKD